MKEQDYLNGLANTIKIDIINSLQTKGRFATGKTIDALEVVEKDNQSQLLAPTYIDILEKGRPPTGPNAPAANPSVFERIKEWCAAKGIDAKAAYPITMTIHKYGYKGKPGVLTEPLGDENINKRADEVAGNLADLLIFETLNIKA